MRKVFVTARLEKARVPQRAYRIQISKYHPDKVAHLGKYLRLLTELEHLTV